MILPLDPSHIRELRPLLAAAYHDGQAVFGQVHRDTSGTYLAVSTIGARDWRRVLKILNHSTE